MAAAQAATPTTQPAVAAVEAEPRLPEQALLNPPTAKTLAYRAFWQENRPDVHNLAIGTFRKWADGRRPRPVAATADASSIDHETRLRIDPHQRAGATEATLSEQSRTEQAETSLRVFTEKSGAWLWVDVNTTAEADASPAAEAATNLVEILVAEARAGGGNPRVGNVQLSTTAQAMNPDQLEGTGPNLIRLANRMVPVVVVAHDYDAQHGGADNTMTRAHSIAHRLAGVAVVRVVPRPALSAFDDAMGPEMGVGAGEARIYLPGAHPTDRHHTVPLDVMHAGDDVAAHWCLSLLRSWLKSRRPPGMVQRLRERRLARPVFELAPATAPSTEPATGATAALETQLKESDSNHAMTWEALQAERNKSRSLAQLIHEREHEANDLYGEVERLEEEVDSARTEAQTAGHSADALRRELDQQRLLFNAERDRMVHMLMDLPAARERFDDAELRRAKAAFSLTDVTSVSGAIAAYQQFANEADGDALMVIPDEALVGVEELDRQVSRASDGRDVLEALLALDTYAHAKARTKRGLGNNFWDWCRTTDSLLKWPATAQKLAMSESEEVMRRPEFVGTRVFAVDEAVDPSGQKEMQAHMKLSNSPLAPRLYFHDDTRGKTGKVHVGYIGKHLETKRFR